MENTSTATSTTNRNLDLSQSCKLQNGF